VVEEEERKSEEAAAAAVAVVAEALSEGVAAAASGRLCPSVVLQRAYGTADADDAVGMVVVIWVDLEWSGVV